MQPTCIRAAPVTRSQPVFTYVLVPRWLLDSHSATNRFEGRKTKPLQMIEKSAVCVLLIATFLGFGLCAKLEVFFQQKRNFFAFHIFQEAPTSATSNQSLSEGSSAAPCLQPAFCYQVMSDRRVALIESQMRNGSAAAIFYPQNASLLPVALSYVLKEGTSPQLPTDVRLLKEFVIPSNIAQSHLILFSNDIGHVETVGEMVGPNDRWDLAKLKLQTFSNQPQGSRMVYISGRMETQSFWLRLKFPSIPDFTMVFVPVQKMMYPPSPPIWINWGNRTITETLAAATGAGGPTTSCALFCILLVNTFLFCKTG
ncbi:hypothetical protein SprV_0802569300 [Sparganum proliferum]